MRAAFADLPRFFDHVLLDGAFDPLHARFLKHVGKTESCWLWRSVRTVDGYGRFWFQRKFVAAHRIAHALWIGPIPDGLLVCHRCNNPACVNPAHLYAGTNSDNMQDRNRSGYKPDLSARNTARGSRGGQAKLTEQDVSEIKRLRMTQAQLAEKFGVSQSAIMMIRTGRTWRHVE